MDSEAIAIDHPKIQQLIHELHGVYAQIWHKYKCNKKDINNESPNLIYDFQQSTLKLIESFMIPELCNICLDYLYV